MKYEAVIFDLFGTLIDNFTVEVYQAVLFEMACVLGAPAEEFSRLWGETFDQRCTGILKSPEENIDHVCRELGVFFDNRQREEAARMRYAMTVDGLAPKPGAVETLKKLKASGYKLGLVTDCSEETVSIWPDTEFAPLFDMTVFSCRAGVKKPDPRIYRLAIDGLAVRPEDCLYVGDGSSNELTGAAAVGMHPVLIIDPREEENGSVHRVQAEGDRWSGPVITKLEQVQELLDEI